MGADKAVLEGWSTKQQLGDDPRFDCGGNEGLSRQLTRSPSYGRQLAGLVSPIVVGPAFGRPSILEIG